MGKDTRYFFKNAQTKKEENKRHIAQHNNQVLNIFWKHILDILRKITIN